MYLPRQSKVINEARWLDTDIRANSIHPIKVPDKSC